MKMYTQEEILAADLPQLMDMCEEAYKSERNQKLLNNDAQILYRVGIGKTVFAKAFGFKTMDYYSDMKVCLKAQLQWKLWNFYVLQDDTPFDMEVGIDYATAYEPSMYGMDYHIQEGLEPTYADPIIKEPEDLETLQRPDFYTSGLMPVVHKQYKELQELVDDRFHVFFPGFARGPWSIATILRGFDDLFFDMADDPDYVEELVDFAVETRISWEKQRCEFLGIDPTDDKYRWKYVVYRDNYNSDSFEDEVDGNMFSKTMFEDYVLPAEKKMNEFYGFTGYYHSCGNLTPFLEGIVDTLQNLKMLHVSAWTDYDKAIALAKPETIVQVSLDPLKVVLNENEEEMREKTRYFLDHSNGRRVDICPDAIYEGGQETLDKVLFYTKVFREELAAYEARK